MVTQTYNLGFNKKKGKLGVLFLGHFGDFFPEPSDSDISF